MVGALGERGGRGGTSSALGSPAFITSLAHVAP